MKKLMCLLVVVSTLFASCDKPKKESEIVHDGHVYVLIENSEPGAMDYAFGITHKHNCDSCKKYSK